MSTLVLGSPPPELRALLARRRQAGVDRLDEVWEGVRHLVPGPSFEHARLMTQLAVLLGPLARAAGLMPVLRFTVGESEHDYRVPDGGLVRPGAAGVWQSTAAMVVEVLSAEDQSREKLPFYAEHHVDEVLLVDPAERKITWLALGEGEYAPVQQSALIDLGPAALFEQLDWP
jgi:Uma2 family endonuclease